MLRLIFAMIALVAAGAIFFMYTQPAYDAAQQVQAQVAEYNSALDKATQLQTLKQSLLSEYNAFDPNDLDRLQKLLPDDVNNIALILDLDSVAQKHGLSLQNVDVSSSPNPTSAAQSPASAIGSSNQAYNSITMTFSTQGSYDNFVGFLTDLETSLRILDLTSLTIASPSSSANPSGLTSTSQGVYSYDVALRTYWLK